MRISFPVVLLLISASVLAAIHILSLELYLYWQYPWFDLPVHALGGATVAIGFFACRALRIPLPRSLFQFVPIVLSVLAVGLLWEIFELWAGVVFERNYVLDTTVDLLMDIIGGAIGYFVASRTYDL